MTERVLVAPSGTVQEKRAPVPSPESGWRMIGLAGVLFGAIGWLDILLLWFPLHLGSAEWEFGTISATFDALPLATLGLGLALASVFAMGWPKRLKSAQWFVIVIWVVLLAALVLYALDVPLAWKGVAPQTLPMLKRAIAKTAVLAVAYLVIYGWFGVLAFRRARLAGQPPRG